MIVNLCDLSPQRTLELDPANRASIEECLDHEAFHTEQLLTRNIPYKKKKKLIPRQNILNDRSVILYGNQPSLLYICYYNLLLIGPIWIFISRDEEEKPEVKPEIKVLSEKTENNQDVSLSKMADPQEVNNIKNSNIVTFSSEQSINEDKCTPKENLQNIEVEKERGVEIRSDTPVIKPVLKSSNGNAAKYDSNFTDFRQLKLDLSDLKDSSDDDNRFKDTKQGAELKDSDEEMENTSQTPPDSSASAKLLKKKKSHSFRSETRPDFLGRNPVTPKESPTEDKNSYPRIDVPQKEETMTAGGKNTYTVNFAVERNKELKNQIEKHQKQRKQEVQNVEQGEDLQMGEELEDPFGGSTGRSDLTRASDIHEGKSEEKMMVMNYQETSSGRVERKPSKVCNFHTFDLCALHGSKSISLCFLFPVESESPRGIAED